MYRRRAWLIVALTVACGSAGQDELESFVECNQSTACPAHYTCLVDRCVANGSLAAGQTCDDAQQCGYQLTCDNYICKPGCSDVYQQDDCDAGMWCKPIDDSQERVGQCSPSECDLTTAAFCADGSVCVAITAQTGGCLPYCEYGFSSGTFQDNCLDSSGETLSCQPIGINLAPVCLPAGDSDGPKAGDPGCHAVHNPCQPGSICLDVVCRTLCFPQEPGICEPGEVCVSLGERTDMAYCRAP